MRTTLNIEDDVLLAARERAWREGRTIGEVLSDLARQALIAGPTGTDGTGRVGEEGASYGFVRLITQPRYPHNPDPRDTGRCTARASHPGRAPRILDP